MPGPADYLQDDEVPLREARRHPLSIVDALLLVWVPLGLLGVGAWIGSTYLPLLPWVLPTTLGILAALGAGATLAAVWRVQTSLYVLTPERCYKSYGRLRFRLLQTTYDKVTDLHVRQGIFGRLGGFGTVTIETAGTGIAMEGIRDPFTFKKEVEAARSAFLHALVAEHRPAARHEAVAEEAVLAAWRPTVAAFLGGMLRAALFLIPLGFFVLLGAFGDERSFLVVPVVSIIVLGLVYNLYVRLRHTEYELHPWGVVVKTGLLTRRRVETTFDKVTDVTTYQGLLGRALGFGNITINTAGSSQAPVVFHGLAEPEVVKAAIDGARRRHEGRA